MIHPLEMVGHVQDALNRGISLLRSKDPVKINQHQRQKKSGFAVSDFQLPGVLGINKYKKADN